MEDRIARLTEKQRACLRLVLIHRSSKEIAREIGIGVDAVDQRIKTAMKTLGVQSRVEAARLLAAREVSAQRFPLPRPAPIHPSSGRPSRWLALGRWVRRWIPQTKRGRFLLWSAVAGIGLAKASSFVVDDIGWPLDSYLIHRWERSHPRPASGDIVLVAQDSKSMGVLGPLPWPRQTIAKIVRELNRMGAKSVAINTYFVERRDPVGDSALAAVFRSMDYRIILPIEFDLNRKTGKQVEYFPLPEFRRRAELVNSAISMDSIFSHNFTRSYYYKSFSDTSRPSLALILAREWPPYWNQAADSDFPVNFSIDLRSLPTTAAIDVLLGTADRRRIRGKEILIAEGDWDTTIPTPIGGIPRGYYHMLAAETLKRGPPWEIPWWMAMAPALFIIAFCGHRRNGIRSLLAIGTGICGTLLAAWYLEPNQIYLPMTLPIALLTVVGTGLSWAWLRRRFASRRAVARNPA